MRETYTMSTEPTNAFYTANSSKRTSEHYQFEVKGMIL